MDIRNTVELKMPHEIYDLRDHQVILVQEISNEDFSSWEYPNMSIQGGISTLNRA